MSASLLESFLFPAVSFDPNRLKSKLQGKTILITGATYGIGEALALRLAEFQVKLLLVARTAEKLAALKNQIEAKGAKAEVFVCDLYREEEVSKLCLALNNQNIAAFVSNAGKSIKRSIWDSLDRQHDFTRTIAINYLSPVQICLTILPQLAQNQGQIINVSALNVQLPPAPHWAAYQASKTAFEEWLLSVAPELAGQGIVCTNVYLPLVRTRMIAPTEQYKNAPAMQPEAAARILAGCLYKRQKSYAPWWLWGLKSVAFLFRPLWNWSLSKMFTAPKSR